MTSHGGATPQGCVHLTLSAACNTISLFTRANRHHARTYGSAVLFSFFVSEARIKIALHRCASHWLSSSSHLVHGGQDRVLGSCFALSVCLEFHSLLFVSFYGKGFDNFRVGGGEDVKENVNLTFIEVKDISGVCWEITTRNRSILHEFEEASLCDFILIENVKDFEKEL